MPRICHALQLAFSKIWLTVSSCVSLSSALWLTGLLPRGHPPFPATSRELVTGNSEVEHMTANPQSLLCTLRPRLCNQRLKVRGTYWIKQFIHSPLSVIRQIAMESVYPGAAPKETHPRCRTARGETSSPPLRSFHSPLICLPLVPQNTAGDLIGKATGRLRNCANYPGMKGRERRRKVRILLPSQARTTDP